MSDDADTMTCAALASGALRLLGGLEGPDTFSIVATYRQVKGAEPGAYVVAVGSTAFLTSDDVKKLLAVAAEAYHEVPAEIVDAED